MAQRLIHHQVAHWHVWHLRKLQTWGTIHSQHTTQQEIGCPFPMAQLVWSFFGKLSWSLLLLCCLMVTASSRLLGSVLSLPGCSPRSLSHLSSSTHLRMILATITANMLLRMERPNESLQFQGFLKNFEAFASCPKRTSLQTVKMARKGGKRAKTYFFN